MSGGTAGTPGAGVIGSTALRECIKHGLHQVSAASRAEGKCCTKPGLLSSQAQAPDSSNAEVSRPDTHKQQPGIVLSPGGLKFRIFSSKNQPIKQLAEARHNQRPG